MGKQLVAVDKFFASSKLVSVAVIKMLKPNMLVFVRGIAPNVEHITIGISMQQ